MHVEFGHGKWLGDATLGFKDRGDHYARMNSSPKDVFGPFAGVIDPINTDKWCGDRVMSSVYATLSRAQPDEAHALLVVSTLVSHGCDGLEQKLADKS